MVPHSPAPCGLRMDPQQTHHNRCSKGVTSISSADKRGPGGRGGPSCTVWQTHAGSVLTPSTVANVALQTVGRWAATHLAFSDALVLVVLVTGAAPRSNRVGLLLSGCTRLDGQLLRGIHGHSPPRFCSQQGHRPANQEGVSFESSSP
jgi:hypothetical protein